MFRINQSGAICPEFEAELCKFAVIPLATLQSARVSIREGPIGGKERIGGESEKGEPSATARVGGRKGAGKVPKERREKERQKEGRGRRSERATSAYFMNP